MESKWYCHSDFNVTDTEGANQTSSRVQLSIYQTFPPKPVLSLYDIQADSFQGEWTIWKVSGPVTATVLSQILRDLTRLAV